ncbi:MAG: hypothetical protein ACRDNM_00765 [Gaiellaceae bacterium]
MIDVEREVRRELEVLLPAYAPLDWDEVMARARRRQPSHRRGVGRLALVAFAAVVVVAFTTPLGAAVVHGIGDFSTWLRGEPGTPAPTSQQHAFENANQRSWLHFPPNTKLRQLGSLVIPSTGQHVDLMGFRAGTSLCLRVIVTGTGRAQTQSCVPTAELKQASAPAQVVLVDHGFGKGKKRARYGLDRYTAPALQVTAGIAADGIRAIVLEDQAGKHTVKTSGNAFVYVAITPQVGQRVTHIWAKTSHGLISIPFAQAPFGLGGPIGAPTAPGPTHVQRRLGTGTIGWLDHHRPVGEPLTKLTGRAGALVRRHTVFGRIVVPDPTRPFALAITLSTSRHGGKATGLCTWMIMGKGAVGGGCAVRANMFTTSPFSQTVGLVGGSDQAATVAGVASDDVARIVAYLSGGGTQPVPLHDNAYVVDIARSKLPARLVAYDTRGQIIGISQTVSDMGGGPGPAPGKAHQLLKVKGPTGATAELYIGPSTTGGHCMYVRTYFNAHTGGTLETCAGLPKATQLALSTDGQPTQIVTGQVAPKVAHVILNFADGSTQQIAPTDGYVLVALGHQHLQAGQTLVEAVAVDANGKVLARERLAPPKHR